jgi:pheromone shutdown-related protein TraB
MSETLPMDESESPGQSAAEPSLPKSVRCLTVDGREIRLVGTAHVSKRSVDDVRIAIELIRPDTVCVELDEGRYRNLIDSGRWRKTNIGQVVRQGRVLLLLSSLIMTSFQRRIGQRLGVTPGAELLEAVKAAEEVGARVVLADRDIQVTLRRAWSGFGFFEKLKIASQLVAAVFVSEEIDEKTIEELKREEKLGDVLELLAREFPAMKRTLIDERDIYLAERIRTEAGPKTVAVVGAGHVPGIVEAIQRTHDLKPLDETPPASRVGRSLKWGIPALIVGLLVYGFLKGGVEESLGSIYIWLLVNGVLSAGGAALALGHPLTVLAAFLAAPLTSLNPMMAAGWVSGLVQAVVKKPTVQDLENLPEAILTVGGFWRNPVSRILLVVVFSNLGSSLGTFVAGSWIAARVFG